jgi:DNA helicase-2/ATP-dependent DNA helicase PcrA
VPDPRAGRSPSVAWAPVPAPTEVARSPDIAGLVAGLEPAQREAVLADDPVVCVLAGAGTGKTRVLTLRVARRVRDRSAHPTHVLVCTFSRKAAEELRDRLFTLGVGREVQAGTFHRAALRLITHYRHDRSQPPPAIVADRRPLLADLLEGRRGTPRERHEAGTGHARGTARRQSDIGRLDAEISWAKSRLIGPSDFEEAAQHAGRRSVIPPARVAELYDRYEVARRLRGVLDLDDLLWHCGDLLAQDSAFARAMRWWHRHLFVDEMQDMNDAQYRLLRLLVGEEPDLFVVGDPNQSVYGWNGADPELLHRVTEEYAGTRVVRLETNHRCPAPVVRVAAAALGRNGAPPSTRAEGPLPTVACLENDEEEARWVARQIWLAHRPGRRWSSIAVLARTNAQLARIAAALDAEHVPHRAFGAEVGPASDVRDLHDGLVGAAREGAVAGAGRPDATGPEATGPEATGPDATGPDSAGPDATGPEAAGPRDDRPPVPGSEEDEDAVVLSTLHRAKGLQWRTVFVVGVSDGLVPLATARSRAAKAEERRLLYVALTRAEEELTCSWARRAGRETVLEGVAERRPSPWLSSVEQVLAELREGAAEASPSRAAEHLARIRGMLPRPPAGADVRA